MHANSIRRAGAVLLTVAAGVSLLLGAGRAPAGGGGYRVAGQAAPVQGAPGRTAAVRASPVEAAPIPAARGINPLSATSPISAQ